MMWRELVRICTGGGGHRTTQASVSGAESGPGTEDGEGEALGDGEEPHKDDVPGEGDEDNASLEAANKSVPSRSMISLSF